MTKVKFDLPKLAVRVRFLLKGSHFHPVKLGVTLFRKKSEIF